MTNVTLIGFGNMGKAIAKTLTQKKTGIKLFICDRDQTQLKNLPKLSGTKIDSSFKSCQSANFIILAVKPQDMQALAEKIKNNLKTETILVSIAAGLSIQNLQKIFIHKKIVRIMPNLGLLVGQGIAAWKMSKEISSPEKQIAISLINKITENFEVKNESDIDSVTAISGSGPAYFFYLAESILKASLKLGLTETQSQKLVSKTFLSAADLQSQGTFAELISRIASKKGTTEAAIKVFQNKKMDKIILNAVTAAAKRAKELSNG